MNVTLYWLADRYVGVHEREGSADHPLIRWWHSLCTIGEQPDEIPWCSSFVNGIAWELDLPRSYSAAARSWIKVGDPISLADAERGFDVVIIKRGGGAQPGPENTTAPGHVGLYSGQDDDLVYLLGGNQGNRVCVAGFDKERVIGVRRLL